MQETLCLHVHPAAGPPPPTDARICLNVYPAVHSGPLTDLLCSSMISSEPGARPVASGMKASQVVLSCLQTVEHLQISQLLLLQEGLAGISGASSVATDDVLDNVSDILMQELAARRASGNRLSADACIAHHLHILFYSICHAHE